MAKRREFDVFTLSFLDVMSCGFGAVILIFIVIQHSTETTSQEVSLDLLAEVKKLEIEVLEGTDNLVVLKTTLKEAEDEIVTAEDLIRSILEQIRQLQATIALSMEEGASQTKDIRARQLELKELEESVANLKGTLNQKEESGDATRTFVGQGDRQYLTGLHLGGEHILILIDSSASMLDSTIVNVLRRRNMDPDTQRASKKWQRVIRTIDWIVANIPNESNIQLVHFNSEATSLVPDGHLEWVKSTDRDDIDYALERLGELVPKGGTSLHHPFSLARRMNPQPDSIFLLVDGLPTIEFKPSGKTLIESKQRVKFFENALEELPNGTPVNVILFPMEGDIFAAPNFWRLAQITGGSFLSPSEDWP